MSNSIRTVAASLLVSSVSILAVASHAVAEPVKGGTAVIALAGDPPAINPNTSTGVPNQLIGCIVYEALIEITTDLEIVPVLAESYTVSADGTEYEFKLKDTRWHDGVPFTSEDVKYTFEEISLKYGGVFPSAGRQIASIDAVDPRTVKIKLHQPYGPFLKALACAQGAAIMPKHIFEGTDPLANEASISKPVGTGPFKLVSWKRGDQIVLDRNEDYHAKPRPYLDKLIAKVIPEASAMISALKAGEIDTIGGYFVPTSELSLAKNNPDFRVDDAGIAPLTDHIFINIERGPLQKVEVRQALLRAIDRDFLVKNVYFGIGQTGKGPFNSNMAWTFAEDVNFDTVYPYDIEVANKLLDDAGFPKDANGKRFSLNMIVRADQTDRIRAAQAMKAMWKEVGIDVEVLTFERAIEVERVFSARNFDLTIQGYTSFGDPALGVARTYVSSSVGKPFGNPSGYSNPEVDNLFLQAEKTADEAERAEFYKQAQRILAKDLPVVPFREVKYFDVSTTKLNDLWGGLGIGYWDRAWLKQ
jgi:peptide/nickel transport system substrate-binding protein